MNIVEISCHECKMDLLTNNLLESTPSCKSGIDPREDHSWRVFHIGGWIKLM